MTHSLLLTPFQFLSQTVLKRQGSMHPASAFNLVLFSELIQLLKHNKIIKGNSLSVFHKVNKFEPVYKLPFCCYLIPVCILQVL